MLRCGYSFDNGPRQSADNHEVVDLALERDHGEHAQQGQMDHNPMMAAMDDHDAGLSWATIGCTPGALNDFTTLGRPTVTDLDTSIIDQLTVRWIVDDAVGVDHFVLWVLGSDAPTEPVSERTDYLCADLFVADAGDASCDELLTTGDALAILGEQVGTVGTRLRTPGRRAHRAAARDRSWRCVLGPRWETTARRAGWRSQRHLLVR